MATTNITRFHIFCSIIILLGCVLLYVSLVPAQEKHLITDISHTAISVSNLKASKAFYRDVLGMKVVRELKLAGKAFEEISGIPGAAVDISFLQKGNTTIELLHYLSPQGEPNPHKRQYQYGIVHIAFIVQDADAVYEVLSRHGLKSVNRPKYSREGGPKIFSAYGPDEEVLEFIQLP